MADLHELLAPGLEHHQKLAGKSVHARWELGCPPDSEGGMRGILNQRLQHVERQAENEQAADTHTHRHTP